MYRKDSQGVGGGGDTCWETFSFLVWSCPPIGNNLVGADPCQLLTPRDSLPECRRKQELPVSNVHLPILRLSRLSVSCPSSVTAMPASHWVTCSLLLWHVTPETLPWQRGYVTMCMKKRPNGIFSFSVFLLLIKWQNLSCVTMASMFQQGNNESLPHATNKMMREITQYQLPSRFTVDIELRSD